MCAWNEVLRKMRASINRILHPTNSFTHANIRRVHFYLLFLPQKNTYTYTVAWVSMVCFWYANINQQNQRYILKCQPSQSNCNTIEHTQLHEHIEIGAVLSLNTEYFLLQKNKKKSAIYLCYCCWRRIFTACHLIQFKWVLPTWIKQYQF